MFKSLFAFAAARPLVSAVVGLTLVVGTGVAVALNCECATGQADSVVTAETLPIVLASNVAAEDGALTDAVGTDCPWSKDAATTTVATAGETSPNGEHDPQMAGCERSCARSQGTFADADVVAQPGAKLGDLVRCPVSGVVFEVTEGHTTVAVAGDSYYTCCGPCGGKLNTEPARFLNGVTAAVATEPTNAG